MESMAACPHSARPSPYRPLHCPLQALPPLVGIVEEARLNLVLLYCRRGDPARALGLLRGTEPSTALEHICQVACGLWLVGSACRVSAIL